MIWRSSQVWQLAGRPGSKQHQTMQAPTHLHTHTKLQIRATNSACQTPFNNLGVDPSLHHREPLKADSHPPFIQPLPHSPIETPAFLATHPADVHMPTVGRRSCKKRFHLKAAAQTARSGILCSIPSHTKTGRCGALVTMTSAARTHTHKRTN